MTRFKLQDWADYVRGVLPAGRSQEMALLLADNCVESQRLHHLASHLRAAAGFMEGASVPDSVFQRAVAIFPAKERESLFALPVLPLHLVFDSLVHAHPAGLRSLVASSTRQTAYESDGLQLRITLEKEPSTGVLAVVGQLSTSLLDLSISRRPIFIYHRDQLVARTLSGDAGEFQLEFSARDPLRLLLLLENPDRRIELDLVPAPAQKMKLDPLV